MAAWVRESARALGILTCSALLLISATLGQSDWVLPGQGVPVVVVEAASDGNGQPYTMQPAAAATAPEEDRYAPSSAGPSAAPDAVFSPTVTSDPGRPGGGTALPEREHLQFQKASPVRMAPVRLQIPRVGVDAPIQPVGVTAEYEMEAPDDYWEAGWYRYGVRPGDNGRAVLAGHLDSREGAAVFFHLRDLEPGDQIRILLGGPDGERYFIVRETARYPAADAPVNQIFGPSDHPELILITCAGDFHGPDVGYSDRFVVYADMVVSEPQGNRTVFQRG